MTVQPCEDCEVLEQVEGNPVSGLWYLYGETGLEGTLSGWEEQVFMGFSQNRESSESSDMGEYCNDISSLETKSCEKLMKNQHNNGSIYVIATMFACQEIFKVCSFGLQPYQVRSSD